MSESICMWCDDGWPMSQDEPGCHEIEAEGQYATVPCRRPEEYAKYEARTRWEERSRAIWLQACEREKGYDARGRLYVELLKQAGLISEKGKALYDDADAAQAAPPHVGRE